MTSKLQRTTLLQAQQRALDIIKLEASGVQTGYKTRYSRLNTSMLKWWRPGVVMIAGLSGVGKSTLVNNLEYDFTDTLLNADAYKPAALLHFNFETPSHNEFIRTLSDINAKSFAYLLSSELDPASQEYNRITDDELVEIQRKSMKLTDRKIEYVDGNGTTEAMEATFVDFMHSYPNHGYIIIIDHLLLTRKEESEGDGALIQRVALFAHDMYRKYNALVVLIHLLNNEIMQIDRVLNNALHRPRQSDIYYGAQVYWACDDVFIMHDPSMIGISQYTEERLNVVGLKHLYKMKTRFGIMGNLYYHNELKRGTFTELTKEQVDARKNVKFQK